MNGARKCRACGCTDDEACALVCWWVELDLCSTCAQTKVLLSHREQRDSLAKTIGCSCGWCPSSHDGAPTFLRQHARHVLEKLSAAA